MFLLVVLFSMYFITNLFMKWTKSPIIITLSSMQKSIKDIPFPAVTVCSMNPASKDAVLKIPQNSSEFPIIKSLCRNGPRSGMSLDENLSSDAGTWPFYREVLLKESVYDQNEDKNHIHLFMKLMKS